MMTNIRERQYWFYAPWAEPKGYLSGSLTSCISYFRTARRYVRGEAQDVECWSYCQNWDAHKDAICAPVALFPMKDGGRVFSGAVFIINEAGDLEGVNEG